MIGKNFTSLRQKFRVSENGATAVEFALVGPAFLYIIFAILETGIMLLAEFSLQTAVQDAARTIRTGQAQSGNVDAAMFRDSICDRVIIMPNCRSALTVYVKPASNFTTLNTTLPGYMGVGIQPNGQPSPPSFGCGGPGQAVGVIATYDWKFLIPNILPFVRAQSANHFLGNVNGGAARRLNAIAIFRNESFPAGQTCQ